MSIGDSMTMGIKKIKSCQGKEQGSDSLGQQTGRLSTKGLSSLRPSQTSIEIGTLVQRYFVGILVLQWLRSEADD